MKKSKIIIFTLFMTLTIKSTQANIFMLLKGVCDLIAGTGKMIEANKKEKKFTNNNDQKKIVKDKEKEIKQTKD